MKIIRRLAREDQGVATIEMAFALPVLITMVWIFVQFAQIYRALAGIQQALGEGARYATLCLTPSSAGCTTPTASSIKSTITNSVYGIGPGTFTVADPVSSTSGSSKYFDLTVSYTQPTDMLFFIGPTVNVSRTKRVWVAGS
ncbi:MAG: TadE/TadG family type IV pilus assembly protein [Sphingomicrobium sp.]